jgi:hypothetical protein
MNLKLGKLEKTMSSIEKATSTQNEKLDNLDTELTQSIKNQNKLILNYLTKYIYHAFGSGAIIM